MTFGENCRKYRTERKLTQEQVAAAIGISKRTYTYYESGEKYPRRMETIRKLAEFFEIDPNQLVVMDDEFLIRQFRELPPERKMEQLTEAIRELMLDKSIPREEKIQFCRTITGLCPGVSGSESPL